MSSSPTEQAFAVTMPQMGVSVAEGTIVEWLKRPGDWVESDEIVCVVTTDKVDVEIPSPGAGRLERILVEPGETVAVGTTLAEIDDGATPGEAHREEETAGANGATAEPASEAAAPDRSHFYSPVVRRIAAEHGVDLERVEGHGVGGRIRKSDLLGYIEGGETAAPADSGRPLHSESPYVPDPAPPGPAPEPASQSEPAPAAPDGVRREPMTPMRQAIARHMVESRRTSAHCTTITEVDLGAVVDARAGLRDQMAARGVGLTYLAFVAEATVAALQRHPILNASIEGDEIVHHDDVNLGIAVALETGLIVPVVERAQRLNLEGLAAAIEDLATRARAGELAPDEVSGGTFTITNPGRFGSILATPIINQPQVAILDLEAVVKRPVVVEGGTTRRRRLDRDPPDDQPLHVVGPPRPRRRGGGALPGRDQGLPRGLEGGAMMALEHEELHVRRGERTGLYVVVAVHSTALGPALGGARLWRYDTPGDAVSDALRLSAAMTLKAAAAGLDLGGGKCVLCADGPLGPGRRHDLLLDLGDAVESLGGRYVTAEDVGTSPADMAVVAERTAHVTGLPSDMGGCGDPSPLTARGVEAAIRASLAWRTEDGDPAGRRVAVIGVGHVGLDLARRLVRSGAEVLATDVDPAKREAAEAVGARWVEPGGAEELDCDVLAPCALGGAIHEGNANALRTGIVCGAANNVLADDSLAARLDARGILYAPDFIANAGGLMGVAAEHHASSPAQVSAAVDGIEGVLTGVYERAAAQGRPLWPPRARSRPSA